LKIVLELKVKTVESSIQSALQHHRQGRLLEAESTYREILATNPNDASTIHLLGVLYGQRGDKTQAIDFIRRAIALQKNIPEYHANLAWIFLENGEPANAVVACTNALAINPNNPEALNHLASALKHLGNFNEAMQYYARAMTAKPKWIDPMNGLADLYRKLGKAAEAEVLYKQIASLNPHHWDSQYALAELLLQARNFPPAMEAFTNLVTAYPSKWAAYNGLANALHQMGRMKEAAENYGKAISLAPDIAQPLNNLGLVCTHQGQIDEAVVHLERALAIRPDFPDVLNNLGNAYLQKHDLKKANEYYDRALFFQPDHHDAHWNRSLLLLRNGDFERGWKEYEWRWIRYPELKRHFRQPLWDGFDIEGKTILLHSEQGLGDTFQFVRFVQHVVRRGATINLECQREIAPLLNKCQGVARIINHGDPIPPFDAHCPLMSLPGALGLKLEDLPATEFPYIFPEANLSQQWHSRISERSSNKHLKVGIVWAGSLLPHPERSVPASLLGLFGDIPNVDFFSIQKPNASRPATELPPKQFELIDLTSRLYDFAETAALISSLDLIISIDTSVAHLAGALGKMVWLLLPFFADWRWHSGDHSPWYPTMRLFRQTKPDDWQSVIERVISELAAQNVPK
jgi:Flp pilus assembly protein TadD